MDIAVEVFEVIGAICAIITLIFFTYIWIYKLGGLVTKIDTMWDIYVVGSLSSAVNMQFTQRRSLYRITDEGKKILDEEIMGLISAFAKSNKKLKNESDERISDKFITSKEFRKIKELIFADDNLRNDNDLKAFLGLVFAYTIEKIKREKP